MLNRIYQPHECYFASFIYLYDDRADNGEWFATSRVNVAITPIEYWESHKCVSDWHLKLPCLDCTDIYQVQESIFESSLSVDNFILKLRELGFKELLEFQQFINNTLS